MISGVVRGVQRIQARVATREKQLVAWAHLLGEGTVKRTRAALHVVDALRIAGYAFVVLGVVKHNAREENLALAVGAMLVGWVALSAAHLGLRDAVLARAFATMAPAGANAAPVTPRVVLSAAADAAVRRARTPPKPKVRPQPAVRLAPVDDDRDAVDFDDAMSGPILSARPRSDRERAARDFDDV